MKGRLLLYKKKHILITNHPHNIIKNIAMTTKKCHNFSKGVFCMFRELSFFFIFFLVRQNILSYFPYLVISDRWWHHHITMVTGLYLHHGVMHFVFYNSLIFSYNNKTCKSDILLPYLTCHLSWTSLLLISSSPSSTLSSSSFSSSSLSMSLLLILTVCSIIISSTPSTSFSACMSL